MTGWSEAKALGVVHPSDRCAYCDASYVVLELVLLDGARALVCEDRNACFSRSAAGKQLMLDVDARSAVDRAVSRCRAIQIAEAIGHFLRGGAPGASRFEAPVERAA